MTNPSLQRERNAAEVLGFVIVFLLTAPGALNLVPLPPSLEQAPIAGHLAGALLLAGCVGGIISVGFIRRLDPSLLVEQLSVGLVAFACLLYIGALVSGPSLPNAAWAIAFTVVIGLICGWRFRQIQRYVKARKKAAREATP